MKADNSILQLKYSSVILALSELKGISLRQALDIFYNSEIYTEMREGISDMHCRSDKYLAEEIIRDTANVTKSTTTSKGGGLSVNPSKGPLNLVVFL